MKLYSIASGSSGNCIFVGSEQTNLLVDVGISAKRIEDGLKHINLSTDTIDGILITHEHSDHIKGVGVISRKYQVPIYATRETIYQMKASSGVGKLPEGIFHEIVPNESFEIKDIMVHPFSTSHDAANPVCYTMTNGGKKVAVATDLGTFDDYTIENLYGAEALLLEANHDVNMLMVGTYPYYLKQRILGDKGHLSNELSADLLCKLITDKLKYIFLAHLSKENNYEELAFETVRCELIKRDCLREGLSLRVAKRDVPSELVIV